MDEEKRLKAKIFATNVKKYRKEKNLSQVQVAELADTSTRQVQAIEYGDRIPNVILAYYVAKALEVSLDQLLEES